MGCVPCGAEQPGGIARMIKTTYSWDYLERREGSPRGVRNWIPVHITELARESGYLHWTYNTANGKLVFSPYLGRDVLPVKPTDVEFDQIMQVFVQVQHDSIFGLTSFWNLYQTTGIFLSRLMQISKWLVGEQKIDLHVNRLGQPTFCKKRL